MASMSKVPENAVSFSVEEHVTTTFETDNESSETSESEFADYVESFSDTVASYPGSPPKTEAESLVSIRT